MAVRRASYRVRRAKVIFTLPEVVMSGSRAPAADLISLHVWRPLAQAGLPARLLAHLTKLVGRPLAR